LQSLGGLIHFVQDVTNPAHVAPVFHVVGDTFDNFDFTHAPPDFISESECRTLESYSRQKHSYMEVLDSVAQETLKQMAEPFDFMANGKTQSITWKEAFWDTDFGPESKQNGFGHYGHLGNRFGSTEINGATISPGVHSDFAKRQIRRSLNATIVLIEMFLASDSGKSEGN
jgi:hypothetical protein